MDDGSPLVTPVHPARRSGGAEGSDAATPPPHEGLLARFDAAVTAARATAGDGPELLPSRLATAAADVLGVAGTGISLLFGDGRRLPIGSSSPDAVLAERLQFTEGDGPCWAAQSQGRPVVAGPHEMAARWPEYSRALQARTPYRAVVSLPLDGALSGIGTVDLYLSTTAELRLLPIASTIAIAGAVTRLLTRQLSDQSDVEPPRGPVDASYAWLDSPGVAARTQVWQAMGTLNGDERITDQEALGLLRSAAKAQQRTVEDVAGDLLAGRLEPADLCSPAASGV